MNEDFTRVVSLACHDLRTPLATLSGFARTLARLEELGEPASRYVEIMVAASDQLAELLEDVSIAARIEGGRYEPNVQEVDSLELARAAAEELERAEAAGEGGVVRVDRDAAERALAHFARCAIRHGGLERLTISVDGPRIALAPVTPEAAPIVVGEEMRDLGAAVAARVVTALGGSFALEEDRLDVRLPS